MKVFYASLFLFASFSLNSLAYDKDFRAYGDFQMSSNSSSRVSDFEDNTNFRGDFGIDFTATEYNNSASYGASFSYRAGYYANFDEGGASVENAYAFVNRGSGKSKTEFGFTDYVSEKFRADSSIFAAGSGGIDGQIVPYIVPRGTFNGSQGARAFIYSPKGYLSNGFGGQNVSNLSTGAMTPYGDADKAPSISHYTPRKSGFKLGFSYIPLMDDSQLTSGDRNSSEFVVLQDTSNTPQIRNAFSVGLNFAKQWANTTLVSSLTYDTAGVDRDASNPINDLEQVTFGFNHSHAGFTHGGSYSYIGDSLYLASQSMPDSYKFDYGAGWSFGPYKVSTSYFRSKFGYNEMENFVFGAEKNFTAKDLDVRQYFEFSLYHFDYKTDFADPNSTMRSNNGIGILIGTEFAI